MKVWIAYITVAIVWGSTYFGIAEGVTAFNTFGMVASRYLLGAALALAMNRITREPLPSRRDALHLGFQGLLLLTGSNALITWAEGSMSSSATAVLASTSPLYYAILGRERLRPHAWFGLALGLSGVAILVLANGQGIQGTQFKDALAILLSNLLWAYGTLHGRKHVRGTGLMGQVAVQMAVGGTVALVLVPCTGGFLHSPLTWKAALAVGYLGVFGSLVAFSAFVYLSRSSWPPTLMSTYVYINPVVAVILGCLVLGEPFRLSMVLGMAVILLGVALLQAQKRIAVKGYR